MTGWRLALHRALCGIAVYRRGWNWWVSYSLHRLQGYGRFDAWLSMTAHKRLGTKMYWHPPAKRAQLRAERCDMMASHEH